VTTEGGPAGERRTSPRQALYPVVLEVAGEPCLVVGGGLVAARKIAGLLACGAAVTVVAPEVHEAVAALSAEGAIAAVHGPPLDVQIRPYREGEAASYRLVHTATGDPAVDSQVHRDAQAAGVWVNSADDYEHCSFVLPAVMRDGPVLVAVSTSGASPALAVWLRDRLRRAAGEGLGELAELLAEARARLKARTGRSDGVDWGALLDGSLPTLVANGRIDEARRLLEEAIEDAEGAEPGLAT